ncbi:MAG TPA: hypothetical protein VFC58_02150 [Desulfosporosinus sp.]|nr:hypothetical protein [Desulfosporosinus sp.]
MKNIIKNKFLVGSLSLGLLVSAAGVASAATSPNYPCANPVAGASYATNAGTQAGTVAGLTGQSMEQIMEQRATGITFGTIAQEAGKFDEFKVQTLEQKKIILDQRVKDGNLTQAQADQIYNSIKTNQATCDGTGSAQLGQRNGAGFGQGQGPMGTRQGNGNGNGRR